MNKCCKKCGKKPSDQDKWRYTLYTTVLFLIIVNPFTYQLTNAVLKTIFKVANPLGCPTIYGILLHAIIFTILLRYMMDLDI